MEEARPPAYFMERVSDLRHIVEVMSDSPRSAKSILAGVMTQLRIHHDENPEFMMPLVRAADSMLDNPNRAKDLIMLAINVMEREKEDYDAHKEAVQMKHLGLRGIGLGM